MRSYYGLWKLNESCIQIPEVYFKICKLWIILIFYKKMLNKGNCRDGFDNKLDLASFQSRYTI